MAATTERSAAWHWRVARLGVKLLAVVIGAAAAYDSLPAFFMALAAVMVLLALAALFQSLRTAFADPGASSGLRIGLPERAALVDEKNVLLRAIKDIAFEHEVGKLSEADFARLDRAYRHRAKDVLRKLDEDLAPYLERAERLVGDSMREPATSEQPAPAPRAKKKKKGKKKAAVARRDCPECGTSNAADAEACTECGASVVPVECGTCGATNDADAKFCKKCASVLGERSGSVDSELDDARDGDERARGDDAQVDGDVSAIEDRRSDEDEAADGEPARGEPARGEDA